MTVRAVFLGGGQLLDVRDPADAHVLTVVAEDALVAELVEDRAHDRPARAHEVRQLLLREAEVLPEAVLAAGGEPARQLPEGLGQPGLGSLEREALEPAFQPALAPGEQRGELP